jgi:CRISPR-associated endonuclease/helicase Cas3
MLSSFVVGTIDQLLFAALRSRHLVLRHLGLAGKVVVVDEAHAYDVYMSTFLDRALEWLGAYHVPVVVLSATLPAHRRAELMRAYDQGRLRRLTRRERIRLGDPYAPLVEDKNYPLVTVSNPAHGASATTCADSGRGVEVTLRRLEDEPSALVELLRERLADGGCALVIHNTVARVQATAAALRDALGPGFPVSVAHSRFMALDRAAKDKWLRASFGPPGDDGDRPVRHIVVASQVAEQSLDIDFDLLVTDLAPVDLVLQRLGRVHRHPRLERPSAVATPTCWITGADWAAQPPEPVSGSRRVYQQYTLLRSAAVLLPHLDGVPLRLPEDIAPLTQVAYQDEPVGPPDWQPALAAAHQRYLDEQATKEGKARSFRLEQVAEPGTPLLNWLAGGTDAKDDRAAQGHVRDSTAESLEVLLLVRTPVGLVLPPWISGGGIPVPTGDIPEWPLSWRIAQCSLPLPQMMTAPEVIDTVIGELESRIDLAAWQADHWLAGELVLDVDGDGRARVGPFDVHYDRHEGLRVVRS